MSGVRPKLRSSVAGDVAGAERAELSLLMGGFGGLYEGSELLLGGLGGGVEDLGDTGPGRSRGSGG